MALGCDKKKAYCGNENLGEVGEGGKLMNENVVFVLLLF